MSTKIYISHQEGIGALNAIQNEVQPIEGHTDPGAIQDCFKTVKEYIDQLRNTIQEQSENINNCRDYLMGTEPKNINASDALISLGYNSNGLRS